MPFHKSAVATSGRNYKHHHQSSDNGPTATSHVQAVHIVYPRSATYQPGPAGWANIGDQPALQSKTRTRQVPPGFELGPAGTAAVSKQNWSAARFTVDYQMHSVGVPTIPESTARHRPKPKVSRCKLSWHVSADPTCIIPLRPDGGRTCRKEYLRLFNTWLCSLMHCVAARRVLLFQTKLAQISRGSQFLHNACVRLSRNRCELS